jgi:uncharacterized membrane protein YgcG
MAHSAPALTALAFDKGELPVVRCGGCGRESLTWLDVGAEGHECLRCLSCDAAVDERRLRLVGERSVERLGYAFLDRLRRSPDAGKLSGCGANGVGSCGGGCSGGGCSSGGCGSGGGCSTR